MPYERQLKEKQVYKTLSICAELIKSDVNLKFRLKVSAPLTLSKEDVFKKLNIRTVPCAYATPTSNGLLHFYPVHHKDKKRKRVILTSYWNAKIWFKRVLFPIFSTFSVIANLLAYVRVKNYLKTYTCML